MKAIRQFVKNHFPEILILLGAILLFYWFLGATSLWDHSEPEYAQVIREVVNGHWLTLMYNGQPYFTHPPLFFWLTASTCKFWGFSEFALRFWAAFFGVLNVLMVYLFGRALFNRKTGLLSAVVFMTMFHPYVLGRLVGIDSLLNFLLLLSLYGFFQFYSHKKRFYLFLFYLGMILTIYAKGPYGIFQILMVAIIFLMFEASAYVSSKLKGRQKRRAWWQSFKKLIKPFRFLGCITIVIILGHLWYIQQIYLHGQAFTEVILGKFLWSRVFSVLQDQGGSFWYYLPVLLIGLFPWTFCLGLVLKNTWLQRRQPSYKFILAAIVPTFIFFSLAGTKLPNYILLIFPFLAVAIGSAWHNVLKNKQRFIFFLFLQTILMTILLISLISAVYPESYALAIKQTQILIGGLVVLSVISMLIYRIKKIPLTVYFGSINVLGFFFLVYLVTFLLPAVEPLKPSKRSMIWLKPRLSRAAEVYAIKHVHPSVLFYLDKHIKVIPPKYINRVLSKQDRKMYIIFRYYDYEKKYKKIINVPYQVMRRDGSLTIILNKK